MNLRVETPDEVLARLPQPLLEPVEEFRLERDDWLILCAGFEDRAVEVLRKAFLHQEAFNVLLIGYKPFVRENKNDKVRAMCRGVRLLEIDYDRQNPQGFGSKVAPILADCRGRVFVDVSAMSRLLIVQILVMLGTRPKGFLDCTVAYSEAQEYPPTQSHADRELARSEADPTLSILFLSSGVFEITILPELGSIAPAAAQTRLIVFPSLDTHHLTALRNEIQPSRLTLIEGVPPNQSNQWRQDLIAKINGVRQIRDAEICAVSTLDYRATLNCLLMLYRTHSLNERLVIAPTGSKMQSVAVGIFRAFASDIQVVYPTPHSFPSPDDYTHGVGQSYALHLDSFSPPGLSVDGQRPVAMTATGAVD